MEKDIFRTGVAFLAVFYQWRGKALDCLLLADNANLKTTTVKLRHSERWHMVSTVSHTSGEFCANFHEEAGKG